MKTLLPFILAFLTLNLSAQDYIRTGKPGKLGLKHKNGNVILKKNYNVIYPCVHFKDYIVAGKKSSLFLINANTKKETELSEESGTVDFNAGKCYYNKDKKIKFVEKGKIGMLKFPNTIILTAKYDDIRMFDGYPSACLLEKNNLFSIYYFYTKKFSARFSVSNPKKVFFYDNNQSHLPRGNTFPAKVKNKWYLMKVNGETYPIEKYNKKVFDPNTIDDYILTKQNGKYGYMYNNGVIQIECIYEDADWFTDYISPAELKGKYGLIDNSNRVLIPFIYDKIKINKDFRIEATYNNKTILLDEFGELIQELYPNIKNKKFGYTNDTETKTLIEHKYDFADAFYQGIARVNIGGKYKKSQRTASGGKWGYIIATGDKIINCIYEEADNFSEGKAKVKKDGKVYYIDAAGKQTADN